MIQRATGLVYAFALLVVMVSATGCISSGSVSEYEGPSIGDRTLSQIEPTVTSQAWVLAVLGEPTERTTINDSTGPVEIWKWTRRRLVTTKGKTIVVSSTSKSEEIRTVYVEFKDQIVTRAWRD